jgi:DNA-binding transcriptional MerR regulator
MNHETRTLSPAEAARRLGVSAKALRLYERHGLVAPQRSANGWRVYGPAQMARLHQVLALKRLGLTLGAIAALIARPEGSLEAVLALQEKTLTQENARVTHALALVRAARAKLAAGACLSIDDLTQLTKETTMPTQATPEEMKAMFDPLIEKHYSPEERAQLGTKKFDQEAVSHDWETVIGEAKALMDRGGDPGSPAALALARRWQALVQQFTGGDPAIAAKARAVWGEAMADPAAAPRLPLNPALFAFMGQAVAKLKETGE